MMAIEGRFAMLKRVDEKKDEGFGEMPGGRGEWTICRRRILSFRSTKRHSKKRQSWRENKLEPKTLRSQKGSKKTGKVENFLWNGGIPSDRPDFLRRMPWTRSTADRPAWRSRRPSTVRTSVRSASVQACAQTSEKASTQGFARASPQGSEMSAGIPPHPSTLL